MAHRGLSIDRLSIAALVTLAVILVTATTRAAEEAEGYLDQVEKKIMSVWKLPPKSDGLKVALRYNLGRDGSVTFVRVEKSSGNRSFDDSAVQAVKRASPFPPPPKSFPIGDLRMILEPTLPAKAPPLKQRGI